MRRLGLDGDVWSNQVVANRHRLCKVPCCKSVSGRHQETLAPPHNKGSLILKAVLAQLTSSPAHRSVIAGRVDCSYQFDAGKEIDHGVSDHL